jgi:hypothetical protein
MMLAKATIDAIENDIKLDDVEGQANLDADLVRGAGVHIENDSAGLKEQRRVCEKYRDAVIKNLKIRFSDTVSQLCDVQKILHDKEEVVNFDSIAQLMNVSASDLTAEWRILRRLPTDLSDQNNLIDLASSSDKCAMFPVFSVVVRKLLLLPIGTASVERSFSTMNRILCSERCQLLPSHCCQLMQLSIEGQALPDVRESTEQERAAMERLLKSAYDNWLAKPRRGID